MSVLEIESSPKTFSFIFHISMWWRIIYGCLRIILGLTLLRAIGEPLVDVVTTIMEHELLQKSPDILFTIISHFLTQHDFSVTYFLSFYFIFWGSIDVTLSYFLLKDKILAFPISLGLIGLFIIYSIFRLTYTHSLVLLAVIMTDIVIMIIIYNEYLRVKKRIFENQPISNPSLIDADPGVTPERD